MSASAAGTPPAAAAHPIGVRPIVSGSFGSAPFLMCCSIAAASPTLAAAQMERELSGFAAASIPNIAIPKITGVRIAVYMTSGRRMRLQRCPSSFFSPYFFHIITVKNPLKTKKSCIRNPWIACSKNR